MVCWSITEGRFFCYRAVITKEPSPCICTFAMSLMILLVLICSTKVSENLTWQNPEPLGFAASRVEELFVAQALIKKVKLKCCGIKVLYNFLTFRSIFIDSFLGGRW